MKRATIFSPIVLHHFAILHPSVVLDLFSLKFFVDCNEFSLLINRISEHMLRGAAYTAKRSIKS